MKNIHKFPKSFIRDESGSILIMAGVFILVAFAIAGAAVDFGRGQLIQIKQQQAIDIAALAAANVLEIGDNRPDEAEIRTQASNRYYNLNFSNGYLGSTVNTSTYSILNQFRIDMTSTATLPTNYINTMGTDNLSVSSAVRVEIPNHQPPDFDVVMVVDQTGSTSAIPTGFTQTIMETEKDAISKMLDVIFPDGQPVNPNVRFGLIGYSGPILNAKGLTSIKATAQSYIDNLEPYYMNYDMWGLEAGMKMATGDWQGFTPPTHCDPDLEEYVVTPIPGCVVDHEVCYPGNTNGPGWCDQVDVNGNSCNSIYHFPPCLPERNTNVPVANTNRDDGRVVSNSKNIVFVTDGYIMRETLPAPIGWFYKNNLWPQKYLGTIDDQYLQVGDSEPNYQAFLRQCQAIKEAGVTIYTINFVTQVPEDVAPMRACASTPDKYYYAPNAETLESILSGIALQFYRIRIVR